MIDRYELRFPGVETRCCRAHEAPFQEDEPDTVLAAASWWYMDRDAVLDAANPVAPQFYIAINQTFLDFTDDEGHRDAFLQAIRDELRETGYELEVPEQESRERFDQRLSDHGWHVTREELVDLTPATAEDSNAFFSIPAVSPFPDTVSAAERERILDRAADRADTHSGRNAWKLFALQRNT